MQMHTINIKIQWKLICLPIASRAQIRVDGGIWRGQENLHDVSILHSVVSWSVLGPQSGAIEGEADHNEAEALPPTVSVHQLSQRGSLLDFEVDDCPVLVAHLQVEY